MTSASELFTSRRARAPRLSDPDTYPDPHADGGSHDPHGLAGRRRRRGCRSRRPLDAAGDVRQHLHTGAPPSRRRASYTVRTSPASLTFFSTRRIIATKNWLSKWLDRTIS